MVGEGVCMQKDRAVIAGSADCQRGGQRDRWWVSLPAGTLPLVNWPWQGG
jgi:hypothetical protein